MQHKTRSPQNFTPAQGERAALLGYFAQNRAAAVLLLRELQAGRLEWARFGDLTAGRVDDLQIGTPGRLDAYQFKWSDFAGSITLHGLVTGKQGEPSIIRALADGWRERSASFSNRDVYVHFVTNNYASPTQNVAELGTETGQRHFAAFVSNAWEQVQLSAAEPVLTGGAWVEAWRSVAMESGLDGADLTAFVRHCFLQFRADFRQPPTVSEREAEAWESTVRQFVERLFALPSEPRKVIEIDRGKLLDLFGLSEESLPRHRHEFRLAEEVYEPLEKTTAQLHAALDQFTGGYLCLIGSPGSGKSTVLTQVLRARSERVVRYYAFTPDGANTTRGEAVNFFADLVGELERMGVPSGATTPHRFDRLLLRERFQKQLAELARAWEENRHKTVILIDGLDHIEREQHPSRSLLRDLPAPGEIPPGVVIVLGTQTDRVLRDDIQASLREMGRRLATEPLSPVAVRRSLRQSDLESRLDESQRDRVIALTEGHPLALGYLIRRLQGCDESVEIDAALNATIPYDGDIERQYRTHWNAIETADLGVRRLLGFLARLRHPADVVWLRRWAAPVASDELKRRFSHYFRRRADAWQFFHNSFRVFVLRATAEGITDEPDPVLEAELHAELADHCAKSSTDSRWRWEELFHRSEAGDHDAVLRLATPEFFRAQFFAWRPRRAIFDDFFLATKALVHRQDGLAASRLVLVKGEVEARFDALQIEQERLIELLLRTGHRAQALAHVREGAELLVGNDSALAVCNVLLDLGDSEEAARVFDLIDPHERGRFGPTLDETRAQRNGLISWTIMALRLMRVEDVLAVVMGHPFVASERHTSSTPPDPIVERHRTLAQLSAGAAHRFTSTTLAGIASCDCERGRMATKFTGTIWMGEQEWRRRQKLLVD